MHNFVGRAVRHRVCFELAAAGLALFIVVGLCWAMWGFVMAALAWTGAIFAVVVAARAIVDWLFDRLGP